MTGFTLPELGGGEEMRVNENSGYVNARSSMAVVVVSALGGE